MIISYVFHSIEVGFCQICLLLSKGFFFWFYKIFFFLNKIIPCSFFSKVEDYFEEKMKDPNSILEVILIVLIGVFLYTSLYVEKSDIHYVPAEFPSSEVSNDSLKTMKGDLNLYRNYSHLSLEDISFGDLVSINSDFVSWILVNGTSINYPVVQSNDNDYYLNHDFKKNLKMSGWIFMDYRNSSEMIDSNTIFYGHNLLNQTAFGSLSKLFTSEWIMQDNHNIMILNKDYVFIYEVFSTYTINPEIYYLQTNFYSDDEYLDFLNILKNRSTNSFNVSLNQEDKIITLSTCTEDNKGRRVVHAKLVSIKKK